MNYPVVIHKDRKSDYGVSVPDLPGCVSAGTTVDEALAMIREAIELHLEGLIEEGGVVPLPTPIERLRADPDYADATWAIVNVDESTLRVKIARVGITMPQRVLDAIDRHARSSGETRSGLLARAAVQYIGRDSAAMPEAKRGGSKLRILRNRVRRAAKRTRP
ncbi:MAG: type II toxin-antitoxin system HicB family antitoxin [Phycisphaerales bacterium]